MSSQMDVALICKLRGALMCLAYLFDMLSMGVCKTRHWQTSGRLVQELNACTIYIYGLLTCSFTTKSIHINDIIWK